MAAVIFTLVFVVVWPGSMLSGGKYNKQLFISSVSNLAVDVLDVTGFRVWTTLSRGWAYVAAAFIIIIPLFQVGVISIFLSE